MSGRRTYRTLRAALAALLPLVSGAAGVFGQTGTCCTANGTPGCANAACQIVICASDPFCCNVLWDAVCASSASANANSGGSCAGVSDCPGTPPPPPPGCTSYTITITAGAWPTEVSWQVIGPGGVVASGGAPATQNVCLASGCYTMHMYDSFGDGWNGATFTIRVQPANTVVASGTLNSGSYGTVMMSLGAGCDAVTASDCADAVNVCTDLSFNIDPNGFGSVNEVPALGSISNPDYGLFNYNPWGTTNLGCLRAGELNSTWMVVNVFQSGWLEFTFGGLGTQAGFYDWAMWPYSPASCAQIAANQLPPVRCNWNGVSYGGTGLAFTTPPGGSATNFEPPIWAEAGQQYIICFSNWSSVSTSVPLVFANGPTNAIVDCQDVTNLPMELLAFSARAAADGVHLAWTTASERDTDRFEVERSTDLVQWMRVATVPAAGASSATVHYHALDHTPVEGLSYYRLRLIDADGAMSVSPVHQVTWVRRGPAAWPNPTAEGLFVRRAGPHVQVQLFDPLGRRVEPVLRAMHDDLLHFDMDGQAQGLYTVRIGNAPPYWTERVMVEGR
jgi:hypothetical protein